MKRSSPVTSHLMAPRWLAVACAGLCLAAAARAQTPAPAPAPGGEPQRQNTQPGYVDPTNPTDPSTATTPPAAGTAGSAAPAPQFTYPSSSRWRDSSGRDDGYSLLPYTRRGYVGINLGRARFDNDCGAGGFSCDNPKLSLSVYTGGLFNEWFGMELGYMNTGKADRSGGQSRAQGVSLNFVGRAVMGSFNLFAKGGAMYGQTRVSADPLSLVAEGKRRGWGGTYGVGMGLDLTPSSGVVLEWQRHELRFPGASGRDNIDNLSVGLVQRF